MGNAMRTIAVMLAVFGFVSAQAFADTSPSPSTNSDNNGLQPPPYKSIWHIADNGDAVHWQSGLRCDSTVEGFRRTNVYAYKPNGLDVSCNYLDSKRSLITIYLTRRENDTLSDDFEEAKRELTQAMPDASTLQSQPNQLIASDLSWVQILYSRQDGKIREGIWIADMDGWTLEYRATYATENEQSVFGEISALTKLARQSAGARLTLCAKAPVPIRNGTIVTDQNQIMQVLILIGGTAIAAAKAGHDQHLSVRTRTWCVEGPVGSSNPTLLLWHAVYDDGTEASADKITPVSADEASPLMSELDPTLNLVLALGNDGKPNAASQWVVSLEDKDHTWILAIYNDRPSEVDLSQLANDAINNKAKPLGGYGSDGKNFTISVPAKN